MIEHLLYNIIECSLTEAIIRSLAKGTLRTKKQDNEKEVPAYRGSRRLVKFIKNKKTEKL